MVMQDNTSNKLYITLEINLEFLNQISAELNETIRIPTCII